MLKLQLIDEPATNIKLSSLPVTIGRDASNHLVLDTLCISDFHAEISSDEGGLYIVDLLSSGGTFVNEGRITSKFRLKPWDVIRLGSITLEINDPNSCRPGCWVLKTESDLLARQFHALQGKTIVGRDPGCDLTIDGHLLSRQHAEIHIDEGFLKIVDLGSRNGTYLNGKRITEGIAKHGDELRFDQQRFIIVGPAVEEEHEEYDDDKTGLRDCVSTQAATTSHNKDPYNTGDATQPLQAAIKKSLKAVLVSKSASKSGHLSEERFHLDKPRIDIGRGPDNDLVIADQGVSKKHIYIRFLNGGWQLTDNNSSNGVMINDRPQKEATLQSGDKIQIGSIELVFEIENNNDDTVLN
ncbi:MAG: pSer/pThr/pTyr-binding forkhead associated (FHA) protein [Flavobacteriales bacterium]|jgi:pSer/pThr/pTyr-binding forkhead associated (FHA) protein